MLTLALEYKIKCGSTVLQFALHVTLHHQRICGSAQRISLQHEQRSNDWHLAVVGISENQES